MINVLILQGELKEILDRLQLILFHHSPDYDDEAITDIVKKAKFHFANVLAAKQDLEIEI